MPSLTEIKIILAALGCVALIAVGATGMHKIDEGKYQRLVADYAKKEATAITAAKAEQVALDQLALDASNQESQRQRDLAAQAQTQLAGVKAHVPKGAGNCITWGLIRVIDAAVLNVDVNTLSLPPGKTEASCSDLTGADLARDTVDNYGRSARNSERLKSLQAYVLALSKVKR